MPDGPVCPWCRLRHQPDECCPGDVYGIPVAHIAARMFAMADATGSILGPEPPDPVAGARHVTRAYRSLRRVRPV